MNVLLDTHAFLWWVTDDQRLSLMASAIIADGENELFLSVASAWEIVIKMRLGRLRLPKSPAIYLAEQMAGNAIQPLAITMHHAFCLHDLPDIHKDPFDRIIIAQSSSEDIPILTNDGQIRQYDIRTIW
jgi:PIN domain nuclease of toxin-antitoxin system